MTPPAAPARDSIVDHVAALREFLEATVTAEPRLWRHVLLQAEEFAPKATVRKYLFALVGELPHHTVWTGPKGARRLAAVHTPQPEGAALPCP